MAIGASDFYEFLKRTTGLYCDKECGEMMLSIFLSHMERHKESKAVERLYERIKDTLHHNGADDLEDVTILLLQGYYTYLINGKI